MCSIQYPWTYEEYAKQQGWDEELTTDEFAPYCKKYYEQAVQIINNIMPFSEEDRKKVGGPEKAADLEYCLNASVSCGCVSDETYDAMVKFFDEFDELDGEIGMVTSFIIDIFYELYTCYLGESLLRG